MFIRQIIKTHFHHFRRPLNTKIQTSFLITLRRELRQDYSVYNLCVFGHDKDEHEHCKRTIMIKTKHKRTDINCLHMYVSNTYKATASGCRGAAALQRRYSGGTALYSLSVYRLHRNYVLIWDYSQSRLFQTLNHSLLWPTSNTAPGCKPLQLKQRR